jgi:hypothetical protein
MYCVVSWTVFVLKKYEHFSVFVVQGTSDLFVLPRNRAYWGGKIFGKVFSHGRSCNITSSANSLNIILLDAAIFVADLRR